MNIMIEARGLVGPRGLQTYSREIIKGIAALGSANTVEVLHAGEASLSEFPGLTNTFLPLRSDALLPFWLNRSVVNRIKQAKPDVVHFTKSDVPSRNISVPSVVTIHDVIPLQLPETQTVLRRFYWRSALQRAADKSSAIITISDASKRHIIDYLGVKPEKVTAIPIGVDTVHFSPRPKTEGKPYILFVGRWDERKNIPSLIRAFARVSKQFPHDLVIAGRPADKPVDLQVVATKEGVVDRVIFKESVPYNDLPSLYSNADVFVYPSVIEGWGLPPLEAMACGTPVIVSSCEPMGEVVQDVGRIVPFSTDELHKRTNDPVFVEDLVKTLAQVLSDQEMRTSMATAGIEHAKKYSWGETARKTYEVYRTVAA